MLLTLIMNLGMAAGVVTPIPPTPSNNLADGYYPIYGNVNDKKQIDKLSEQRIHNELILVEILKFWSKEMQ